MEKNIENFRDELVKFANIVEILESTFIGEDSTEIITYLEDHVFDRVSRELKTDQKNKCVISIGSVNFIFLKR